MKDIINIGKYNKFLFAPHKTIKREMKMPVQFTNNPAAGYSPLNNDNSVPEKKPDYNITNKLISIQSHPDKMKETKSKGDKSAISRFFNFFNPRSQRKDTPHSRSQEQLAVKDNKTNSKTAQATKKKVDARLFHYKHYIKEKLKTGRTYNVENRKVKQESENPTTPYTAADFLIETAKLAQSIDCKKAVKKAEALFNKLPRDNEKTTLIWRARNSRPDWHSDDKVTVRQEEFWSGADKAILEQDKCW